MYRSYLLFLCIVVAGLQPTIAQEEVDEQIIANLKMAGFQQSQIMETVRHLADLYGPRLTGSPQLRAASEWCVTRLREWGMQNASLDSWGTFGRGWSLQKSYIAMTTPYYMPIIAYPKAWTVGTVGAITGEPVVVRISSPADFEKYRGKLKNAIVLNGRAGGNNAHFEPDARRLHEEESRDKAAAINLGEPQSLSHELAEWREYLTDLDEITAFFHDEGVAAVLEPSTRDHGVLRVMAHSYDVDNADVTFTSLVVAREHFGRLVRLAEMGIPVALEIDVQVIYHEEDTTGANVIAEIAGQDSKLKSEIVMLGAHLDSWHAGTGATDNAAGCAATMEAMRILAASGAKPRRTIRLALWTGEEQDYNGSRAYVEKHFADLTTGEHQAEYDKLSAYFNLDDGTGRIRGIYLQGNEAVRPIFEAWLRPFHYLGATLLTTENSGGSDHMLFDAAGLPGFSFLQDPIEYDTRTHHTNMDVYEAVLEDDLKQAAVVIASLVYHTAMRDEKLPRKPIVR